MSPHSLSRRLFCCLLRCYPREFRTRVRSTSNPISHSC